MLHDLSQAMIDRTLSVFLSPGSLLSLWSLAAAFILAVAVALARRGARPVAAKALARAMFPRHRLATRSVAVDIGFTLLSIFGSALLFGWAVLSNVTLAGQVRHLICGDVTAAILTLPHWVAVAIFTLGLWLAYELAYFMNHWLSHKWPALWAFHKVHHSAETLTPLTLFRVHPVDSIVFYNTVAVLTGVTSGVLQSLFGGQISPATIAGTNVITIAAIMTIKHLQHSHVWIAFGGAWGRIILSPAHHQVHHSIAAEHHDRNFGATLAVFDWLAGTLYLPASRRPQLVFGVDDLAQPHSAYGALVAPFVDATRAMGAGRARAVAQPPGTRPSIPDIRAAAR